MIEFIIKSTFSLGILYLFYYVFLRGLKTFQFNRYFLLVALVFSLVIPFIIIPLDNSLLATETMGLLSAKSTIEQTGEFLISSTEKRSLLLLSLPYIYGFFSTILLVRFSLNLLNIIRTINCNQKEDKQEFTLVLVKEQVLPHTFFKYILANTDDYINGKIDDSLIQHEVAHCKQWHSFDIVFIEFLKVFLWINPFVWLFKKPIQLNHEYLADSLVISSHNINKYQSTLVNIVLSNNGGILISNFNFSLTKQRLKMMTKQFSPTRAIFGKVAAIFTFLLIAITISCNQDSIEQDIRLDNANEWWQPILMEHNINPVAYNNFPNVFEMGTKNAINNGIVSLENAFFLFKPVRFEDKLPAKNTYVMLEAPFVTHNLNTDSIKAENGVLKMYSLKDGKITSVNHLIFSKLKIYVSDKKFWFRADNGINTVKLVDGEIVKPDKYFDNIVVRF